jgi:hypothetical protein
MAQVVTRRVAAPVNPDSVRQDRLETGGRRPAETARQGEVEVAPRGRRGIVQSARQLAGWWLRHWLRYAEAVGAQWR